jgi:hypothetical protein
VARRSTPGGGGASVTKIRRRQRAKKIGGAGLYYLPRLKFKLDCLEGTWQQCSILINTLNFDVTK